jgi:glycosyltransferase involved in cell wall biosynthesis
MSVLTRLYRPRDFGIIYCQHMHIPGNKRDLLHAWQYRRLDAFVTPISWLAERVKERTVLTDDDIRIVPRGIETDRFMNKPPQALARENLGLPQHVTILGVIGRLDPKKGQHVAIRALRRVHDSGHTAHLLIVGDRTLHEDPGYEIYLKDLVSELDLIDWVHFRPHQERPETAYAALDIFILPSESETYGMVTIEAMCSGLPVIGTDAGGTIDLIDHESTGLRFPPGDDAALADAIIRLLENPDFASTISRAAQVTAVARFSRTAQTDAWEELLRQLAARCS